MRTLQNTAGENLKVESSSSPFMAHLQLNESAKIFFTLVCIFKSIPATQNGSLVYSSDDTSHSTFISLWLHYKYKMQELCVDAEKQNMIVANFPSDELQIRLIQSWAQ